MTRMQAGLPMQPWPLTVNRMLEHAARWHPSRELVAREADGSLARSDYRAVHDRARRFSNALLALGVRRGDRVATLAMNGTRHVEAWYAVMGLGAVCHTLNPRLFDEQLVYIVNHTADRLVCADPLFAPLLERILPKCPSVERVIWLSDAERAPAGPAGSLDYESLVAAQAADCSWGDFGEETPCGLCYTSGTTGNPKGVLYTHRSNFLHTLISLQTDSLGIGARDVILPAVPMFHANAWGLPFSAAAVGAKLVLPGARLDGRSLYELLESERVSFSAAVPTVWTLLLEFLTAQQLRLTTLERVMIGGSACPESIIRTLRDRHGVETVHGWGMTELSPIGTIGALTGTTAALDPEAQLQVRLKQGRVPLGVDLQLTDDDGRVLPHDGRTPGRLKVAGPAVVASYYGEGDRDVRDDAGYFDTGDIATIDPDGYLQITDRAKDLIKSGGEWISSVEIENVAVGHAKAQLAAVIAVPHPKWRERPLLVVKLKPGLQATAEEFLAHLKGRIADWWLPDHVVFVDEIPLGGTGKIDKKRLRERFPQAPTP